MTGLPEAWNDIVRWYSLPGTEQACLALQDRYGFDVMVGLGLLWLAVSGQGAVREAALEDVVRTAGAWKHQVLDPLRQARRGIKSWLPRLGEDGVSLRAELLDRELACEHQGLAMLLQALEAGATREAPGDPCGDACLSLARYLRLLGYQRLPAALCQRVLHVLCVALEDYDSLQVERVLALAMAQETGAPTTEP
ncbi:MAG: TIGR02444 family protein [Ectothiorhodospiraceae bacterium]|nr:TIGR02444 family protein [Ectothiorhodospiraceae bacterium]